MLSFGMTATRVFLFNWRARVHA